MTLADAVILLTRLNITVALYRLTKAEKHDKKRSKFLKNRKF